MQRGAAGFLARALIFCSLVLSGCSAEARPNEDQGGVGVTTTQKAILEDKALAADIRVINVSGGATNYVFAVEIESPDTGCDQYADWWEVLNEKGELLYRRILLHSHVDEQPFTRSGGPVVVGASDVLIVRAHLHPDGYGGVAFKGSVEQGFREYVLNPDFADEVEMLDPQPDGCAF